VTEQGNEVPETARHPGGRPRLQFDLRQVEELGRIQSTLPELAAVLGCGLSTVKDRLQNDGEFAAAYERGVEAGKSSLRRLQWKAAVGGNITMQIWLGKQYLGQTDRQMTELSGAVGHSDPALQRLVGLLEGVTQEQARELLSVATRSMSSRHAIAALPPPAAEEPRLAHGP